MFTDSLDFKISGALLQSNIIITERENVLGHSAQLPRLREQSETQIEPTGNLDSKNTQTVFDIFRQITGKSEQTVIAVTHKNDFAKNSDRTI